MRRIYSPEVLRGVAIAIMLFPDAPPDKIYPILKHAPWQGWRCRCLRSQWELYHRKNFWEKI